MPTAVEIIAFIVTPNGYTTVNNVPSLSLSVVVSPFLSGGGGDLNSFPDWQDWPGVINGQAYQFELTFVQTFPNKLPVVTPYAADLVAPQLSVSDQSTMWKTLFPPGTTYDSRDSWTKLPHTHFLSYPAAPIAAFTKSVYSKLPLDRLPTLAEVSEVYAEIEPRLRGVTSNASGSGGESLAAIQAR